MNRYVWFDILHVICICRSGSVNGINVKSACWTGIGSVAEESKPNKNISQRNNCDFWPQNRTAWLCDIHWYCKKKIKDLQTERNCKGNSSVTCRLGSKSSYYSTWICGCTVDMRTLAMMRVSIAVWFALDPVFLFQFWYFCFVKGIYRLKSLQ